MQFGDKEWFEMLEKRAKFPSVFAFYIGNDKTVNSKAIKNNPTNISNIQYRTLQPLDNTGGWNTALASVKWCHTPQAYYEEVKRIMDAWGIVPQAPESTESTQGVAR